MFSNGIKKKKLVFSNILLHGLHCNFQSINSGKYI